MPGRSAAQSAVAGGQVRDFVEAGLYDNEEKVIQDALRHLMA